jgi:hypothetical protein
MVLCKGDLHLVLCTHIMPTPGAVLLVAVQAATLAELLAHKLVETHVHHHLFFALQLQT